LNDQELNNFCKDGSVLYGHPIRDLKNKISFTTGSLGNGIAAASGFAYGKKIKKNNQEKIICLVGDGECNEGIFWETLLLINKFDLNNLIIIIDDNLSSNEGSKLPDLEKIIFAFNNIDYQCVNGHDFNQITEVLEKKYSHCQIIHAKTNYGHGSYITINNKVFHHPKLSQHDLNKIINSLKE
ncbi:1-deoxy-D-xylulose-5-phosphate synthase N-terminal domain-containing protein, partial [Candidatus Pelagibacter sp.]|nr:1-deoxy-D-xylulose-5-phosphate synthase N-terminal domain-containing protein [Candidatus Pelagibacter sp.]